MKTLRPRAAAGSRLLSPASGLLLLAAALLLSPSSPLLAAATAAAPVGPPPAPVTTTAAVGLFEARSDLGRIVRPGSAVFDPAKNFYALTGSGANIWGAADAMQFVWKKMSGDVVFSADVEFQPPTGNPGPSDNHRKAVLMLRQSLDAGSPYLDVATHGDGMTALQFRDTPAGESFEIRVSQAGPKRLRIEKHGDEATVFIAGKVGDSFRFTGAGHTLKLAGDFYVGLGVCSHNDANLETAVFSNVELKPGPFTATPKLYYTVETQSAASAPATDRYALYTSTDQLESPIWLPDNNHIVAIRDGSLMSIPISPTPAKNANGETLAGSPRPASGLPESFSGIAWSNIRSPLLLALRPPGQNRTDLFYFTNYPPGQSPTIMVVQLDLTETLRLRSAGLPAPNPPSFRASTARPRLMVNDAIGYPGLFTSEQNGKSDIFRTPFPPEAPPSPAVARARATNLTGRASNPATDPVLSTGSAIATTGNNYNPVVNGSTIYFTSDRSGTAQVWQMKADGSEPVQLTNDENNNFFSSVSPTAPGVLLFTTWPKDVKGQPDHTPILVRRLNANKTIDVLARITGGPGTAPSWSQDGKYRAFVSQHRVYGE